MTSVPGRSPIAQTQIVAQPVALSAEPSRHRLGFGVGYP